jgi:uncharacterized protein (TIRG00374 family)
MAATLRRGSLPWLGLAAILLTISYAARGTRWAVLLSAERQVPPLTAFYATAVGYLGNCFLPARAGDLIRSVVLARVVALSTAYVLATTFTERILDAAALVCISLASLIALPSVPAWLLAAARVTAVIAFGGLIALIAAPRLEAVIRRPIALLPLPGRIQARLLTLLGEFLLGVRAFQHPGRGLLFLGLTALIWLLDATTAMSVAHAFSFTLTVPQALLLLAALGLASAAPSTPGYVGIYQFVAVTVLPPFGFTRSEALVFIIAFQAVIYMVVSFWGALGLWRLHVRLPMLALRGPSSPRMGQTDTDVSSSIGG